MVLPKFTGTNIITWNSTTASSTGATSAGYEIHIDAASGTDTGVLIVYYSNEVEPTESTEPTEPIESIKRERRILEI